ncbi:chemotaxis protein CheB [Massilia phyllosphaerae]|uniref:chemotaxis protein CheB n=1 Tax=Massilia phyllosphaerae TaxID=3106034 RepID=UPI002B1CCC63|nr:chemotaxis protein CheB [Massilia sp. SGZ-792]
MQKIAVIGGSAGSIDALKVILAGLPRDFAAAVLVVVHIGARESVLANVRKRHSVLPVQTALQGEPIRAGRVLVAPPDVHLAIAKDGERLFVRLSRGPKENHSRPAIDPLFRSAAMHCGAGAVALVLSGFLDDGTIGLQAIKACGGIAVVQDPDEAEVPDMPASAVQHTAVDFVRRLDEIAPTLVELVQRAPAAAASTPTELPDWLAVEDRMFTEGAEMKDLDQIGARFGLTCPECGGAIWEITNAKPLRYRCHTGHAFTARVLESLQGGEAEEALWAAVRALHEQEQLYREMHRKAPQKDAGGEYLLKADQAREHGRLLRDLIAIRMALGPP